MLGTQKRAILKNARRGPGGHPERHWSLTSVFKAHEGTAAMLAHVSDGEGRRSPVRGTHVGASMGGAQARPEREQGQVDREDNGHCQRLSREVM